MSLPRSSKTTIETPILPRQPFTSTKKGISAEGTAAKSRFVDEEDDVYLEFKRRMGTDHVYKFRSSGQQRKPEELSAEILKSLKADVQQKSRRSRGVGRNNSSSGIRTAPVRRHPQGGGLGWLQTSPLLQEPVAAALAYGFQTDSQKAYWLVYDFGGGTFDAALIKSEDGSIHVVNHGGDNFLGGSDIDWAIVEQLLIPRLLEQHSLEDFTRGNKKWRRAFALLKRAAEMAKIELSSYETTTLDCCRFNDDAGNTIEFECDLPLADVIRIAEPTILRFRRNHQTGIERKELAQRIRRKTYPCWRSNAGSLFPRNPQIQPRHPPRPYC